MTLGGEAGAGALAAEAADAIGQISHRLEELRGARILLTGGTGFVGSWLLELLVAGEERMRLGLSVTVLSRDPHAFAARAPHLAGASFVETIRGDVRDFSAAGPFSHVIHAAAESNTRQAVDDPAEMLDTLVRGAGHVMSVAASAGASRAMYVSSGIVYGRQPEDLPRIPEDWSGTLEPSDSLAGYAEGKREAEAVCRERSREAGISLCIARGFSFVGPHMPLSRVAIGQFIDSALAGRDIVLQTDGAAVRSYLYASDMSAWLLAVLAGGGDGRAYNVGSEHEHTVLEVAEAVRDVCGSGSRVVIEGEGTPAERPRYVPSTDRIRTELGVRESVGLHEAIERTVRWQRRRG